MKYFIDCHCHFFNFNSIPVNATLARLDWSRAVPIAIAGPLLAPFMPSIIKGIWKSYHGFISFFENDAKTNIEKITGDASGCLTGTKKPDHGCIFTPLLMDFEKVKEEDGREKTDGIKRLACQVSDMKRGIDNAAVFLKKEHIKILPFLGFDLRRLDETYETGIADWFDTFSEHSGAAIRPPEDRQKIEDMENGDFIGIKLYPPLGGKIHTQYGTPESDRQLEFFKLLNERKIPVTIHCQEDSFKQGPEEDNELVDFGNPDHWLEVMKKSELNDFTINFAHFGGEQQVAKTLYYNNDDYSEGPSLPAIEYNKKTWTWKIIKLLKAYPNTYSDLAAFDYSNEKAVFNLATLISLDQSGVFKDLGEYKLVDKLLWGTDYPMIIKETPNYAKFLEQFKAAINLRQAKLPGADSPKANISAKKIYEKLTCENPVKFLSASVGA